MTISSMPWCRNPVAANRVQPLQVRDASAFRWAEHRPIRNVRPPSSAAQPVILAGFSGYGVVFKLKYTALIGIKYRRTPGPQCVDSNAQPFLGPYVSSSPLVSGNKKINAPPAAKNTDVNARALPIPKRSANAPIVNGASALAARPTL